MQINFRLRYKYFFFCSVLLGGLKCFQNFLGLFCLFPECAGSCCLSENCGLFSCTQNDIVASPKIKHFLHFSYSQKLGVTTIISLKKIWGIARLLNRCSPKNCVGCFWKSECKTKLEYSTTEELSLDQFCCHMKGLAKTTKIWIAYSTKSQQSWDKWLLFWSFICLLPAWSCY